jgi:hypothetical protein
MPQISLLPQRAFVFPILPSIQFTKKTLPIFVRCLN